MKNIIGKSERGKARVLTLKPQRGDSLNVWIHHPNGRSGAAITVPRAEFFQAAQSTIASNVPAAKAGAGGPLFVERRGIRVYLWIRNVGANGWSMYVDARELEPIAASTPVPSSIADREDSKSWMTVLLGFFVILLAMIAGAFRMHRSAKRSARSLRLKA